MKHIVVIVAGIALTCVLAVATVFILKHLSAQEVRKALSEEAVTSNTTAESEQIPKIEEVPKSEPEPGSGPVLTDELQQKINEVTDEDWSKYEDGSKSAVIVSDDKVIYEAHVATDGSTTLSYWEQESRPYPDQPEVPEGTYLDYFANADDFNKAVPRDDRELIFWSVYYGYCSIPVGSVFLEYRNNSDIVFVSANEKYLLSKPDSYYTVSEYKEDTTPKFFSNNDRFIADVPQQYIDKFTQSIAAGTITPEIGHLSYNGFDVPSGKISYTLWGDNDVYYRDYYLWSDGYYHDQEEN